MDSGIVLFIAMGLLLVATVFLAGYIYLLYRFGVRIAHTVPRRYPYGWVMAWIIASWAPICMLSFLLPLEPVWQLALFFGGYLLHAYVTCVGFWASRYLDAESSAKRFEKNVDDWLGEWECADPGEPGEQGLGRVPPDINE